MAISPQMTLANSWMSLGIPDISVCENNLRYTVLNVVCGIFLVVKNNQFNVESSHFKLDLNVNLSQHGGHTVPGGCTAGWAGRGGGGKVKVCNGGTQEGRAGVPGGSRAASCGSEAASEALGGTFHRPSPGGCRHGPDARSHPAEDDMRTELSDGWTDS